MEIAEYDREAETIKGDFTIINSLDKKVLPTERPENSWMYDDLKDLEIVRVANKEDGSAIRFLIIEGELVAKTKFSLEADQCAMAMSVVENDSNLKAFILKTLEMGLCAIFEIVSPFNKVVLSYKNTELKLLQLRDEKNEGKYLNIYKHSLVKEYGIVCAEQEPLYTLDALLELKETVEDKEGWVVTFENGKMAKIKTSWYMTLHGILTDGLKEHKIIEKIIDETIDDVIAMIPEENVEERDFVDGITNVIIKHVNHTVSKAETLFRENWNGNKKDLALKFKSEKELFPYIMSFASGKTVDEVEKIVMERVKFDCRRLELAKKYLRNLGFNKELDLIEDDN
jgi:T4 RnlA family RNA ligase